MTAQAGTLDAKGLAAQKSAAVPSVEVALDRLTDHLEQHLNLDLILNLFEAEG